MYMGLPVSQRVFSLIIIGSEPLGIGRRDQENRVFTGWMSFLSSIHQCQGLKTMKTTTASITSCLASFFLSPQSNFCFLHASSFCIGILISTILLVRSQFAAFVTAFHVVRQLWTESAASCCSQRIMATC